MSNSPEQTTGFSDRLTGRGILRTLFMPEIKLGFGSTGMVHRSFLSILATMFIQSGLLPYNHPARYADGAGKYGFRGILGEAWHNMRHRGGDLQQWGLFFSVFLLFAFAIMAVLTFAAKVLISTANAADSVPGGLFSTPNPDTDLGLKMIDELIGIASLGGDTPAEMAIGQLLSIYSYGVLIIASFIVAWSILSIVVDTAATGRFFGGRHNPVWWPIRLVFALGILIPLGHGFNAGQYMVIQVAKWGSGLASNAWGAYISSVMETEGSYAYLVQQVPNPATVADMKQLIKMYVCMHANNAYISALSDNINNTKQLVAPYIKANASDGSLVFALGSKGRLIPGVQGTGVQEWQTTDVREADKELCGSVKFPAIEVPEDMNVQDLFSMFDIGIRLPDFISDLSNNGTPGGGDDTIIAGGVLGDFVRALKRRDGIPARIQMKQRFQYLYFMNHANYIAEEFVKKNDPNSDEWDSEYTFDMGQVETLYADYYNNMYDYIGQLIRDREYVDNLSEQSNKYGWPSASLWFYALSSFNADMSALSETLPTFKSPSLFLATEHKWFGRTRTKWMEKDDIENPEDNLLGDYYTGFETWWDGNASDYLMAATNGAGGIAGEHFIDQLDKTVNEAKDTDQSFADKVWKFIGIEKIMKFFKQRITGKAFVDEKKTHPIVFMAELGKEMINLGMTIILAPLIVGGAAGVVASLIPWGSAGAFIGSIAQTITMILLLFVSPLVIGGVILSVILPMTPFIRFVFAISTWLIAIVEAVVMVPIIAIGHLRTDGEGLFGPMQGAYGMLLQLLLRPVLIVIGLVLSMSLVEVTIGFVNDLYYAMLLSLPTYASGHNPLVDLFPLIGYAVMYGVLVYGLINSSFKIVDLFPEAVIKYLGTGASGGERDQDQGDLSKAVVASAVFASGAGGTVGGVGRDAAGVTKGMTDKLKNSFSSKKTPQKTDPENPSGEDATNKDNAKHSPKDVPDRDDKE